MPNRWYPIAVCILAVIITFGPGCLKKEPPKQRVIKPPATAPDAGPIADIPELAAPEPAVPAAMDKNRELDSWPAKVVPPQPAAAYPEGPALKPVTSWPPAGEPVRCAVTADDIYSKVGDEKYTNCGATSQWKLKGQQEYTIFDADLSALKFKAVTGALLHVKCTSPEWPYYRVGVSSVAAAWKEGSAERMYQRVEGEACYVQAELGRRDWAYPGSSVMDVVFGRGHTTWKFADCTPPDSEGWQTVAVDPAVVAARLAGVSYGFFVYDEVGHEWADVNDKFEYWSNPNRFSRSREQRSDAPWLEVWVNGDDALPPAAVQYCTVTTDGFPAGQALVKWITPADTGKAGTIGFNVTYTRENGDTGPMPRYLVPMAGVPGSECRMHIQDLAFDAGEKLSLTIEAVDGAGNVSPAFTRDLWLADQPAVFTIADAGITAFALSDNLPEAGGVKVSVIDLVDKVNPVSGEMVPAQPLGYKGGNHLFSARERKVRLHGSRNEFVFFQVALEGASASVEVACTFPEAPGVTVTLWEPGYVKVLDKDKNLKAFMPDPLLPSEGRTSIPSRAGRVTVEAQRFHSLICEVYIPHSEAAGIKAGTLTVKNGGETLTFPVALTVWDCTLPDVLSFIPEMNSYRSSFSDPAWYRLAHRYRVCINQLPYTWNCSIGYPLTWNGTDFDWAAFDAKAGPMLDGSMFSDLPRAGVPVDVFYLPFNESWPVDLMANFTPSYWADEAFSATYADEMKKAYAAFARHCDAKGWHDTLFEFYLNNKVYNRGSTGRNVLPWICDEPRETEDFWALRWWGLLWHQAVDPVAGKANMIFRGDISYSEHGRNMFWGVMDLECLGGANAQKMRMKRDEWVLWDQNYFTNYGSANAIDEPNVQPVAWILTSWANGACGVLPWQTFGTDKTWEVAETTSVIYPDADGPRPSMRLLAFTRGEQDVEYLHLLARAYDQPLFAVRAGLQQAIDLTGKIHKTSETDAGKIRFAGAAPTDLWRLRVNTAAMVAAKKPAFVRALVEWAKPAAGIERLPDIGYTAVAPDVPAHAPKLETFRRR